MYRTKARSRSIDANSTLRLNYKIKCSDVCASMNTITNLNEKWADTARAPDTPTPVVAKKVGVSARVSVVNFVFVG